MTWHLPIYEAVAYSAVAGLAVLALASLAIAVIGPPARRIRVIEIALAALIVLPLVALVPGYPRIALLPASRPNTAVEFVPPSPQNPVVAEESPGAAPIARPSAPPATVRPSWQLPRDVRFWIVAVYLAGVGLMIGWSLFGLAAIARLVRSARVADHSLRAILREVAGPAGDRVALLVSPHASQPCALVWRRPTIVLPPFLVDAGDSRPLRFALAHEWSHVDRGDVWSWWLSSVVRWFYFYQPLIWHLRRQLRLCQDYLADAAAAGTSHEDYAEFLTSYSSHLKRPNFAAGLGIAGRASELHRRIVMLLDTRHPLERTPARRWNLIVVPLAAILLAAVACVRAEPGDTPKVPSKAQLNPRAAASPKRSAPPRVSQAEIDLELETDPLIVRWMHRSAELVDELDAAKSRSADDKRDELVKKLQREILRVEERIDERKALLRPRLMDALTARLQREQPSSAFAPFSGRIRPGDILKVDLAGGFPTGDPNPVTVEPNGYLALGALYGRFPVGGTTLDEAGLILETNLRDILKDPHVQVTYVGHDPGVVASEDYTPAAKAPPPRPAPLTPTPEPTPPPFQVPQDSPPQAKR